MNHNWLKSEENIQSKNFQNIMIEAEAFHLLPNFNKVSHPVHRWPNHRVS